MPPAKEPTINTTVKGTALPLEYKPVILTLDDFHKDVDSFNYEDNELYAGSIDNADAWSFLSRNVPIFDCPDRTMQQIYDFRWWTYRKHLRKTPHGWIVTEFLPDVPWAGKYDSIDCAAGHHFMEGRWILDPQYLDDYSNFWFTPGGGDPQSYSFWAASAIYQRALVTGDKRQAIRLLNPLVANYSDWERSHLKPSGLFWQSDDRDGMEMSIGGNGYRATINSYMYGDADAISRIAKWAGREDLAMQYLEKAHALRTVVLERLWDPNEHFFKVRRDDNSALSTTRELHGYTPWYFDMPPDSADYSVAWGQLMDAGGFYAPYGPTTAERRSPGFGLNYNGHECQWNGPSWPFATSITLTGMANLLNDYHLNVVSKADYFRLLENYAKSQYIRDGNGKGTPWIDEDLNPDTGDWMARSILKASGTWEPKERGKDYNHSTFCDLIITGLVGLRPRPDDIVVVNPLLPNGGWDYFCLDRVPYHGYSLTILWDRTGRHYGHAAGLTLFANGKTLAHRKDIGQLTAHLQPQPLPQFPDNTLL